MTDATPNAKTEFSIISGSTISDYAKDSPLYGYIEEADGVWYWAVNDRDDYNEEISSGEAPTAIIAAAYLERELFELHRIEYDFQKQNAKLDVDGLAHEIREDTIEELIRSIDDLMIIQGTCITNKYMLGLYNGMETIRSTLTHNDPQYKGIDAINSHNPPHNKKH